MAYEDRYSSTKIKSDQYDNLSMSQEGNKDPFAWILYVPDMNKDAHSHISLSVQEANILHEWLGKFLKEHTNE